MCASNFIRIASVCLISSAAVRAQSAPPSSLAASPGLAQLEKAVKDRTAEWTRLSQNLETSLIRLLPCDPKVAASITEVSKASEARIAAVAAYMEAANRQAQLQTSAAKQVAASAQTIGADLAAEKAEIAPERSAAEAQLANLMQSAQRRSSLAAPADSLKQVLSVEQQRSDAIDSAVTRADQTSAALADLVMQLQSRQGALQEVQTAFEAEASRWNAYYAARLARAQLECTVTKGAPAAPATPAVKGKQK